MYYSTLNFNISVKPQKLRCLKFQVIPKDLGFSYLTYGYRKKAVSLKKIY